MGVPVLWSGGGTVAPGTASGVIGAGIASGVVILVEETETNKQSVFDNQTPTSHATFEEIRYISFQSSWNKYVDLLCNSNIDHILSVIILTKIKWGSSLYTA